ncbi:tRNA (adenosine(37)-N6)-threonylcarbamoyltransferase complex dimerization subunit type 1 TsaB [Rothia sp. ZJ1223]|uniref:tRNA (adenosine(37)-N6)-threonylcarbamoyltransferase complex dimerization subunit type 1 TsaB n=1 Tax=Rothia sp. ZJ1223 TaxID=2811098 RepID=UPI00195B5405|nr:tRNA (adenosine(37)-N6)-threonylcarbamoyltransferase complex dimerization subunit type 1 TsaB [Rothia sp. ZJ1223]
MLLLAIDSSATASVTLARLEPCAGASVTILAHRETADTRSHAEVMAQFVREVLNEAGITGSELDAVLTGTGPGPFTGLRAGIVTARTLGFTWNVPVYGLMSLYSIAENAWEHAAAQSAHTFMVAADARRREIYSAIFALGDGSYELVEGPSVGSAAEAPALPAYGFGAGLYSEQLQTVEGYERLHANSRDLVHAAARLGIKNLSTDTAALYLRESDAKVPAARKKATRA